MRDGYWNHQLGYVEYLKQEFARLSYIPEVRSEARQIEQTLAVFKERMQSLRTPNLVVKPTTKAETPACPNCDGVAVTKLQGGQGWCCGHCAEQWGGNF